jgi:hypothetical protein
MRRLCSGSTQAETRSGGLRAADAQRAARFATEWMYALEANSVTGMPREGPRQQALAGG